MDPFQVTLQPGDKLLLCSDGLWEMVRDPKIEDVIKSPAMPYPKQTASALIKAALDGGGEDNVSVIVISVINTPQYGSRPIFQLIAKPDTVQVPQNMNQQSAVHEGVVNLVDDPAEKIGECSSRSASQPRISPTG